MAQIIIDAMDNASLWRALAPDGTPSTEFTLVNDPVHVRFATDKESGQITASTNALNHRLQRTLPATDLTNFDEMRLWLWCSRVGDGTSTHPFFLEIRMASATMNLQDAGNTWIRYLPVSQINSWEFVRLDINDLPVQIRSAVNLIQLRCIDATTAFTCYIDDVLAVREEMIGDVDNALLALLHQQVSIAGTTVPAFFVHPENPPTLGIPSIRITQYDIQYDSERTFSVQARSDFTPTVFRLRPRSIGYSLYYAIDVYADTRQHKAQVMEFVLRTLSPASYLFVNGTELPIEWMTISPLDDTGKWRSDRELLYFKVLTRQDIGVAEQVAPPYKSISIEVDQPL
jgi:hypothetical protein